MDSNSDSGGDDTTRRATAAAVKANAVRDDTAEGGRKVAGGGGSGGRQAAGGGRQAAGGGRQAAGGTSGRQAAAGGRETAGGGRKAAGGNSNSHRGGRGGGRGMLLRSGNRKTPLLLQPEFSSDNENTPTPTTTPTFTPSGFQHGRQTGPLFHQKGVDVKDEIGKVDVDGGGDGGVKEEVGVGESGGNRVGESVTHVSHDPYTPLAGGLAGLPSLQPFIQRHKQQRQQQQQQPQSPPLQHAQPSPQDGQECSVPQQPPQTAPPHFEPSRQSQSSDINRQLFQPVFPQDQAFRPGSQVPFQIPFSQPIAPHFMRPQQCFQQQPMQQLQQQHIQQQPHIAPMMLLNQPQVNQPENGNGNGNAVNSGYNSDTSDHHAAQGYQGYQGFNMPMQGGYQGFNMDPMQVSRTPFPHHNPPQTQPPRTPNGYIIQYNKEGERRRVGEVCDRDASDRDNQLPKTLPGRMEKGLWVFRPFGPSEREGDANVDNFIREFEHQASLHCLTASQHYKMMMLYLDENVRRRMFSDRSVLASLPMLEDFLFYLRAIFRSPRSHAILEKKLINLSHKTGEHIGSYCEKLYNLTVERDGPVPFSAILPRLWQSMDTELASCCRFYESMTDIQSLIPKLLQMQIDKGFIADPLSAHSSSPPQRHSGISSRFRTAVAHQLGVEDGLDDADMSAEDILAHAAFSQEVRCYNCNKQGHIKAHCPSPRVYNAQTKNSRPTAMRRAETRKGKAPNSTPETPSAIPSRFTTVTNDAPAPARTHFNMASVLDSLPSGTANRDVDTGDEEDEEYESGDQVMGHVVRVLSMSTAAVPTTPPAVRVFGIDGMADLPCIGIQALPLSLRAQVRESKGYALRTMHGTAACTGQVPLAVSVTCVDGSVMTLSFTALVTQSGMDFVVPAAFFKWVMTIDGDVLAFVNGKHIACKRVYNHNEVPFVFSLDDSAPSAAALHGASAFPDFKVIRTVLPDGTDAPPTSP